MLYRLSNSLTVSSYYCYFVQLFFVYVANINGFACRSSLSLSWHCGSIR